MKRNVISMATNHELWKKRRWMTSNVRPAGVRTSAVKCSTQKCMISSTNRAAPVMRWRYQLRARPDINLSRNGLTQRREGAKEGSEPQQHQGQNKQSPNSSSSNQIRCFHRVRHIVVIN